MTQENLEKPVHFVEVESLQPVLDALGNFDSGDPLFIDFEITEAEILILLESVSVEMLYEWMEEVTGILMNGRDSSFQLVELGDDEIEDMAQHMYTVAMVLREIWNQETLVKIRSEA